MEVKNLVKIGFKDVLFMAIFFILLLVVETVIIIFNAFVTRIIPAVGDSLVPMVAILMVIVTILVWAVFFKKN